MALSGPDGPLSGDARSSDEGHPGLAEVLAARERIAGIARITPLRPATGLDGEILLKLENRQVTGSFKVRGAANKILALDEADRRRGLVAVSSGNHGRAVAHVAARVGVPATICLTNRVPAEKVAAIEAEGATVVVAGTTQEEADAAARELERRRGLTFVHPFDDPEVIAGQGTVGLEIAEQAGAGIVLVPLSGGGLAGGTAVALAGLAPGSQVIGVSQAAGPAMHRSLAAGRLVDVEEEDTLADALAGGLGPVNRHTFALCRRHLTGTVLVDEEEIAAAMVRLRQVEGELVEGGGAVAYAALLAGTVKPSGRAVVVVSGGNVAPERVARLAAR